MFISPGSSQAPPPPSPFPAMFSGFAEGGGCCVDEMRCDEDGADGVFAEAAQQASKVR